MTIFNQTTTVTGLVEAKEELNIKPNDSGKDSLLYGILDRSRARIEAYLRRYLVARASDLTEFHTLTSPDSELFTLDWPIISITSIHEDSSRVYGSSSLLVEGTDYLLVKGKGKIVRLSGGTPTSWRSGFHAIRIVGKFGYANTESVAGEIKDPALRHVVRTFRMVTREDDGVSSVADDVGRVQYFSDKTFRSLAEEFRPYQAPPGPTGERLEVVPSA